MRRILITAVYLALVILALTLMTLAGRPVETPKPTATQTPVPTVTQTPVPTPTPEHTGPTTIVIDGLELDGIDDLWVGIPVDGMPE